MFYTVVNFDLFEKLLLWHPILVQSYFLNQHLLEKPPKKEDVKRIIYMVPLLHVILDY